MLTATYNNNGSGFQAAFLFLLVAGAVVIVAATVIQVEKGWIHSIFCAVTRAIRMSMM